jgi:hypothetical protein
VHTVELTPPAGHWDYPAYNADPSIIGSTVLKAYHPKPTATISEAKAGAIWDSLIMTDVMQQVIVGKEATKSAVTWGAGQIRDIMKG